MTYKTKHPDRVFIVARYPDRRWAAEEALDTSLRDPKFSGAEFLCSFSAKNEASALSIAKIKYRAATPKPAPARRKGGRFTFRVSDESLSAWNSAAATMGVSTPAWLCLVADRAAMVQQTKEEK